MKRRWPALACLLTAFIALGVGEAAYVFVNVAPDSGVEIGIDRESRAYFDNYYAGSSTPYATFSELDKALENAAAQGSGTAVEVVYRPGFEYSYDGGGNGTIGTLTVAANTTLSLPYEGTTWDQLEGLDDDGVTTALGGIRNKRMVDSDAGGVKSYRKSLLTIANATLEVEGALEVGGMFCTVGLGGNYSELCLGENAGIEVSGALTNYGKISESEENNCENPASSSLTRQNADIPDQSYFGLDHSNAGDTRFIRVLDGGKATVLTAIYDFGGLSTLQGLNSAGICPINILDFPTTQTYVRVDCGGSFVGESHVYVSSGGTNIGKRIEIGVLRMSGSSESALIYFADGEQDADANVSFEYCPSSFPYTTASLARTYINVDAKCSMGSIAFAISAMGANVDVDTSEIYLPLSLRLRISIDENAVLTSDKDIKLLGGGAIEVRRGGSFVNEADLVVYQKDTLLTLNSSYPSVDDDAVILNNGTFKLGANATFGGLILTSSQDGSAVLDLTEVSSGSSLVGSLAEGSSQKSVRIPGSAYFYNEETGEVRQYMLAPTNVLIRSDEEGRECWRGDYLESYSLTITTDPNGYEYPTFAYRVYSYDESGNETCWSIGGEFELEAKIVVFLLPGGHEFSVVSLDRAESAVFASVPPGSEGTTFTSGERYLLDGDYELLIKGGDGFPVRFMCDGESGSGDSTKTISESSSADGTFTVLRTIGGNGGGNVDINMRKGHYLKYRWVSGAFNNLTGNGCNLDTYLYRAEGLVTWPSSNIDNYTDVDSLQVIESAVCEKGGLVDLSGGKRYIESPAVEIDASFSLAVRLYTNSQDDHLIGGSGGGGEDPDPPCVVEGTLVTMADGTRKKIEEVGVGEEVLTFDHESGRLSSKPVLINDGEPTSERVVTYLTFDNGTELGIVEEHGLFDGTLNEYVYIHPEDASSFIGHPFYFEDGTFTRLLKVENVVREVRCYDIGTAYDINFFTEGLLGVAGGIEGLFNIFELGPDMKIDQAKKAADIEKFGLYDYSLLAPYLSEEVFYALNLQYLSVSLGKGLITPERIDYILERYAEKLPDSLSAS